MQQRSQLFSVHNKRVNVIAAASRATHTQAASVFFALSLTTGILVDELSTINDIMG